MTRRILTLIIFSFLTLHLTGAAALSRIGGCGMPCCLTAGCEGPLSLAFKAPPCCGTNGADCGFETGYPEMLPDAALFSPAKPLFSGQAATCFPGASPAPAAPPHPRALAPPPGHLPGPPLKAPLYLFNSAHLC